MESISLTAGGSSEARQPTADECAQRLEVVRAKISHDAGEIVAVLGVDFRQFFEREAKRRYVASDDLTLSPDQLRALKQGAVAMGQRAVAEEIPDLEQWEQWVDAVADVPSGDGRRLLDGNSHVAACLSRVGLLLQELLSEHGFDLGDEDFAAAYSLPTWFISGRLLVSLVESYWRNVAEYRELSGALTSLQSQTTQQQRSEAWDQA